VRALRRAWRRWWDHTDVCPRCGELAMIGMPHDRVIIAYSAVKEGAQWSKLHPVPVYMRCEGIVR
jgi:hypothetical protein